MKVPFAALFSNIKKKYDNLSLNVQIDLIIGVFLLAAITLLSANTYIKTLNQMKQNFKETGMLVLQETADKINSRFRMVENTASMIVKDLRILNFASSLDNINETEINRYLNNCINLNKYDLHQKGLAYQENLIDDIIFTTSNNIMIARRLHFTTYNVPALFKNNPWFKRAVENKGKLIWTDLFFNHTYEDYFGGDASEITSQLNQFMLLGYIVDEKSYYDLGYIAISINLENLSKLIDNIELSKNGNLYIVDSKGRIIAGKDQTQLLRTIDFDKNTAGKTAWDDGTPGFFEGNIRQTGYFVFNAPLSINGWKLIFTIPAKEMTDSVSSTLLSIIIIGAASFIIITAISTLVLYNALHPLKNIVDSIKEIRSGNLTQKVAINGCLEVNQLSTEYNFMLDRINNLLDKIVDEQKALRKSELKAFRAQINPHFLYNTLDSIKCLTVCGDNKKASQLIASISTFFRIGLSGGSEEIPIRDEVEHARQYLFIQKIRCSEKMDYLIDIDTEIENYKTPKLILQPLIENAIFHGINRKEIHGLIKVLVKKENENTIVYEITDNGAGMTPDELKILNEKINAPLLQSTAGNHGYAVRNVNQRIKLSYGDSYGIVFESKSEIGTKVRVTIPVVV